MAAAWFFAALAATASLGARFPATSIGGDLVSGSQQWTRDNRAIATPTVALPGLYSGECRVLNGAQVLAIRLHSDSADARIDDPGGDLRFGPNVARDWGLHLIDVNLVMQDMVDLVPRQLAAWQAARK